MQLLFAAALDLQRYCETQGWSHCFIGGLAVQRWGDPRVTKDADLESVLRRQGSKLKIGQVFEELGPLVELKEEPEILTRLKAAIVQVGLRF